MKKKMMQLGAVMLSVGLALTAAGARHGAAPQSSRARPAEVKTVAKSVEVAKDGEYTSKDEVAALSLPEHYGRNLDAFYDVLTEYGGNWKIVFKHAGAVARGLRAVCADAMAETPGLEIMFEP